MGRISIVHKRSRGASAAAICISSDDPTIAVNQTVSHLSDNNLDDFDLASLKLRAKKLLTQQLDNAFRVDCLSGVSPYISNDWQLSIQQVVVLVLLFSKCRVLLNLCLVTVRPFRLLINHSLF